MAQPSRKPAADPAALVPDLPAWGAYLLTLVLTLLTIALRLWLDVLGDGVVPFALFYPLIMGCTLIGGVRTGLLSLVISSAAVTVFWVAPRYPFTPFGVGPINLVLFCVSTAAVVVLAARLRTLLIEHRESEARSRLAQEGGRIGMWHLDVTTGEVWWSPLFYEVTGIAPDVEPGIEAFLERIHPEDRAAAAQAFDDARLGLSELDTEFRFLRDDGEVICLASRAELFRDAKGNPARMTGVNFDVSTRRKAEEERDDANALLRTIFETFPGAAYVKDPDGRLVMGNPSFAAAIGHEPSSFIGRTDVELLRDKEQARAIMEADQRILREGASRQIVEELILPDGRLTHWLSTKTPLFNSDGSLRGLVGISLDVTERWHAEERLKLLAHEVDHRAKNLLGVVQSMLRLTHVDDVVAFKEVVISRLQALGRAHSLLAASRWEDVSISSVVEEEMKAFRLQGADRIHTAGPAILLEPKAAQALAMALHELVTNAAKYGALSTEAGRVDLAWHTVDDPATRLEMSWTETGGPAVREPTFTGFGTTVIRGSIEHQFGGRVTFDWATGGLACHLVLPLHDLRANHVAAPPAAAAKPDEIASVPLRGRHVLVVEDEAMIALTLAEAMKEFGCIVVGPASTPEAALDQLRQMRVDAAILDLDLAGSSGERVARALEALEIPFIYCTGYADPIHVFDVDAPVEVVTKPIRNEDLANALKRALARGKA